MIELQPHRDGVLLPIKAMPGARRACLRGVHEGCLKVAVTQVAEKGKANKAIIQLLASTLDLKLSQFAVHSGATSSRKTVLVTGIALVDLAERIHRALQSSQS